MNVKPVLGDWEIPRIESIKTLEQRSFVELEVPGRVGSLFQDLNTHPTHIAIRASLFGDEARSEFVKHVREKYQAGEPLTFVADIVTATEIQYVIIQALHFQERGTKPNQIDCYMLLKESPPPPPPPNLLGGIDTGLLDDANGFLDSVTGALDVIDGLGSIPNISDPTPPLRGTLNGVNNVLKSINGVTSSLQALFGSTE